MGRHKKLLKNENMMKANLVNEATSAPGFPVFQECLPSSGNASGLISPGPNGVNTSFFIEWYDAQTGGFPMGNNWSTSTSGWETSGGGSGNISNVTYDTWSNADSLLESLPSQNVPGNGEVISTTINGAPIGCMMYVGTTAYYDVADYTPATINNGTIYKPQIGAGMLFTGPGACTSCMYGAVDPYTPWEPIMADWEDNHHMKKAKPTSAIEPEMSMKDEVIVDTDYEMVEKLREEVSKMKKLIKF